MTIDGLLLAAIALGHLGILVTAVNVSHGFGINWKGKDAVITIAAAAIGLGSLVEAWELRGIDWREWPWAAQGYAAACLAVALVGLPGATLARAVRKRPAGATPGEVETIDLAALEGAEALIGEGWVSRLLRLPGNEALRLTVERWDVEVPGLPEALDGLSVLQLTDLHFARCFRRRFFEAVADEAARQEADLVVFTGDLVDDEAVLDWIVPVMARVRGRLGQFAILGNHDALHHPGRVREELERADYEVVDGRWTTVDAGGATLAIGGTSAPWGPRLDLSGRPEADATIVLSHSPDQFPRLSRGGVDLVLSGHNHGGQVRLPVVGPLAMPSKYGRRFDRGFFRAGRTWLYVGRGVAGKHPLRYGCPPEITRFVLRAARPATSFSGRAGRVPAGVDREGRPA